MNVLTLAPFVCLLAACAAPRVAERTPPVPLGAPAPVHTPVEVRRADADKSAPRPMAELPPLAESLVTFRTVTVTERVEVPGEPVVADGPASVQVGYSYDPYVPYGYEPRYHHYRDRELLFPINTLVGVGIGAAFDHHGHGGHHHHRGAWLGGGLGLLLDLNRVWR